MAKQKKEDYLVSDARILRGVYSEKFQQQAEKSIP